uniref:Ornithine decarboxylase antizyme n=1 Tax=Ciona intestinalis TaxID=7719 RepID=F6UKH7_CIOIN|nr:ornithine decarboxylase antizyme [Ciona intestinalis]|eukprot:XP_026691049.1 ornithine decarboxylase antizyme [Ciona intestinalis]
MKKKRKKQATLPSSPLSWLDHKATIRRRPSLGSAPDVLNNKHSNSSSLKFANQLLKSVSNQGHEIKLKSFIRNITEKTVVCWDTVAIGERLYVHVPINVNRDSFVALLDYAEEELEVSQVVVCIDANSQDLPNMVKAFRFMGFEHIHPDDPSMKVLKQSSDLQGFRYLGYDLD